MYMYAYMYCSMWHKYLVYMYIYMFCTYAHIYFCIQNFCITLFSATYHSLKSIYIVVNVITLAFHIAEQEKNWNHKYGMMVNL